MAKERFSFSFPQKEEILNLMVSQETFRDRLCYGKHKEKREAETAISNLFRIKELIEKGIGEDL